MRQYELNTTNIVDNLVDITSHQEVEMLENSLFMALKNISPYDHLRLFRVRHHIDGSHDLRLLACLANGVFSREKDIETQTINPRLSAAFDSIEQHSGIQVIANDDQTGWHVIYPTFDTNKDIFLVLVHSAADPELECQQLMHGTLKVYANHIALIEKSQRDKLTGLYNRETLDDEITKILVKRSDDLFSVDKHESRRNINKLKSWLGVIDIDHFKAINDNYGHLYGDEVLILSARLMRSGCIRDDDRIYRYGGEEFVVLLRAPSDKSAMNAFERLRHFVEEYDFPQVGKVTISIGFVELTSQQTSSDAISQADEALYFAKQNGRNQTHSYHHLIEQGSLIVAEQVESSGVELF